MSKPIIAIVGRPNVGKSMLFNKIIGRRLSIVEDTPGVTRDRIYGESDWNGRKFTLVDTGGIEPNTDNQILAFMRQQAQIAIDNATVIVLVTDIKTGIGVPCIVGEYKFRIPDGPYKDMMADIREKVGFSKEMVEGELQRRCGRPAEEHCSQCPPKSSAGPAARPHRLHRG